MVKCQRCGANNSKYDKFCGRCGARLPEIKICPNCHYESYFDIFCRKCGSELVFKKDDDLKNISDLEPQSPHSNTNKYKEKELCSKGDEFRERNMLAEAWDCYDEALSINWDHYTLRQLVNTILDMGEYNEALMYCGNALDIIDKFENTLDLADIYCLEADTYTEMGLYENALECCDKAIEIDPNYYTAYNSKAYLLISMGRYNEALECCDKSFELNEGFYPWYIKGEIYFNLKEYDKAMEACEKAKEYDSTYDYLIKLIDDIKKTRKS